MAEYISGQLLDYRINITELTQDEKSSQARSQAQSMIRFSDRFENLAYRYLPGADVQGRTQPFLRTSLLLDST